MNVIVPLGGKGERFARAGFNTAKPLIPVFGMPIISHVLQHLNLQPQDTCFVACLNMADLQDHLRRQANVHIVTLETQTSGAAETVLLCLEKLEATGKIDMAKPTVVCDGDTFYTVPVLEYLRPVLQTTNAVLCTKRPTEPPIYSYVSVDEDNTVHSIREKVKISDNAITGVYGFKSATVLRDACKYVMDHAVTDSGEPYMSCAINTLVPDVKATFVKSKYVFSLGTPPELQAYISASHVCLFDLDGTLVLTDGIYTAVWRELLALHNITMTTELYDTYIRGQSDKTVHATLLRDSTFLSVEELSKLKDDLFIKNIAAVKFVEGAAKFVRHVHKRGVPMAVVTNCNRAVAEAILESTALRPYFSHVVCGVECARSKPHPDPYQRAMAMFDVDGSKSVIFEDHLTGIQSAKSTSPLSIIGVATAYEPHVLLQHGVTHVIPSFADAKLPAFVERGGIIKAHMEQVTSWVTASLPFKCTGVTVDSNKCKGGYISDVLFVTLKTACNSTRHCILKLENHTPSLLTTMANDLNLYDREYYFYEHVQTSVPVETPNCVCIVRDQSGKRVGILMENIFHKSDTYTLNLKLSLSNIDVGLKVVHALSVLHRQYLHVNLQEVFPGLAKHNDARFQPRWQSFMQTQWPLFSKKWSRMLAPRQLLAAEAAIADFNAIQNRLSSGRVTLVHGDVKSPNIFYNMARGGHPCFIDWQYICIGKGVEDVLFFCIESYDLSDLEYIIPVALRYYFALMKDECTEAEFVADVRDAMFHFPLFVSVWFGTVSEDELIDKNFPFFFIQKTFACFSILDKLF